MSKSTVLLILVTLLVGCTQAPQTSLPASPSSASIPAGSPPPTAAPPTSRAIPTQKAALAPTTAPARTTAELLPQPTGPFPPGIAPESARVDIAKPTFSNPGAITNPLLPITKVEQIIQVGEKDGKPHRTEFTLLPGTRTITWNGEQTETRVVQFVAYLDGRILETALDFLAQADGGAVWYFGEEVNNYNDGVVADTDGTWLAGKDGPPAMIMPAAPQVGNVYRVENIPGVVFEEVMVKAINQTIDGPRGPIKGALRVEQIGMDGHVDAKAFAPGYGEFLAPTEDAAVAVPTDALPGPLPAQLNALLTGGSAIFDAASSNDWDGRSATLGTMTAAWDAHRSSAGDLFPLLNTQMTRAINALTSAVAARNPEDTRHAAFDVVVVALDLQLPYRPLAEVDLARFDLWARRVIADTAAADPGAVKGDITILNLIWNRVGHSVEVSKAKGIETQLAKLRAAAEDLNAASSAATALRDLLAAPGIATTTATPPASATAELLPQPTGPFPPGIAADSARIDLARPTFSQPTNITNPLFPMSKLTQRIKLGVDAGKTLRIELSLLPNTKTITWNGQKIENRVMHFVAYLDGQILETALDYFAQADDGSVWYFGEEVNNYNDGVVANHDGAWLAGKDGPPGMIMPANPQVGMVYRPENIPGLVFEQVTVKAINETFDGPRGSIAGGIRTQELFADGSTEDKTFAPGYGEFLTRHGDEVMDVALTVPIDALSVAPPAELKTLLTGADSIFNAVSLNDWDAISVTLGAMNATWASRQAGAAPALLDAQMTHALDTLAGAIRARKSAATSHAVIEVALAALDLQLPYQPLAEIDLARFDLFAQRLRVDAAANPAAVVGDVAILEWIWLRFGHTIDTSKAKRIDTQLGKLRVAADAKAWTDASNVATAIRDMLGK